MNRKQTIQAIRAAGAQNDKLALTRLYTENRISFNAALAAWAEGARLRVAAEQ
jgi:hypothetical protein